ncbi:dienelactone hydrolase family protein [Neokomagataea thailandica]|uniref:Carboxymethylenebutenolidase n=1 Tax=Neokomagataea tanensis NBRC 106556 TaxID=1223519 RepID=A0ABQ0QIG2_9PROT|nr:MULTISPECIES: dienelactone hydrolase family protein [Neokomagataea]GBR45747.1 carboxymethylenebutenolidase [Neokomagataea tanensis NBRC 106556]
MSLEYSDYYDGQAILEAAIARPSRDKAPVVLIAHQWAGRGVLEHTIAERVADLGYIGVAIDLFGKGVVGSPGGDNTHLIEPWLKDRAGLARRVGVAVEFARSLSGAEPDRLAALGYCFGGMAVLDVVRSGQGGLRGVVSLHGLLGSDPALERGDITAKISVHHGWDDPLAVPEQVLDFTQEMTRRKADWQLHAYGHVGHAFTNPHANAPERGLMYNRLTDQRSWQGIVGFLKEVFE